MIRTALAVCFIVPAAGLAAVASGRSAPETEYGKGGTQPPIAYGQAKVEGAEAVQAPEGRWILWYRRPAADWTEALPVGNGRLGAMAFGGTARARIQFNEDTPGDGNGTARHGVGVDIGGVDSPKRVGHVGSV